MDVVGILLYCLYACIQMYILMGVGAIAIKKDILDEKRSGIFSKINFVMIMPLYQVVQISSAGRYDILSLLWIIIINFVLAMGVAYLITAIAYKFCKLEYRIKNAFTCLSAFPAVGALPLVIGYGFCFPGGPIEHDPFCKDFLGVLMLSVVILNFAIFVIGYVLFKVDKGNNEEITVKMSYIWHSVVNKMYKKNLTVKDLFEDFIEDNDKAIQLYEKFEEENKLPEQSEEKTMTQKDYMPYYDKVFEIVEANLQEQIRDSYEIVKTNMLCNLEKNPPRFPTSPKITIDDSQAVTILKSYAEWEKNTKASNPDFVIDLKIERVNMNVILKSLLSPPLIGFFLGMTLAMSKIREFIYSDNLFWTNIIDGFKLIVGNFTPFLFLVIGVACTPINDTTIKKKHSLVQRGHLILIFLVRFLIIPFIGMAVILFWKEVYGHECATSPVVRLVLFFPWCLPTTTIVAVVVSMVDYLFVEYGYIIFLQNIISIITLTLLNLIYFVLVGLDE